MGAVNRHGRRFRSPREGQAPPARGYRGEGWQHSCGRQHTQLGRGRQALVRRTKEEQPRRKQESQEFAVTQKPKIYGIPIKRVATKALFLPGSSLLAFPSQIRMASRTFGRIPPPGLQEPALHCPIVLPKRQHQNAGVGAAHKVRLDNERIGRDEHIFP